MRRSREARSQQLLAPQVFIRAPPFWRSSSTVLVAKRPSKRPRSRDSRRRRRPKGASVWLSCPPPSDPKGFLRLSSCGRRHVDSNLPRHQVRTESRHQQRRLGFILGKSAAICASDPRSCSSSTFVEGVGVPEKTRANTHVLGRESIPRPWPRTSSSSRVTSARPAQR